MIFQLSLVVSQIVEDLGFGEGIREFSLDIYSSPLIQEHKRNIKMEFLQNLLFVTDMSMLRELFKFSKLVKVQFFTEQNLILLNIY